MELAQVMVKLNNSNDMVIAPADRGFGHGVVSAAEIAVLRRVHGEDAVIFVGLAGSDDRSPAAEKIRLLNLYGPVVNELLPGTMPILPNLADLQEMADARAAEPAPNF
jgi:hypothetical protein